MTDNRPKLGEMLVEAELIDELQLKSALVHQQHWRCLFGASLVKLGYLDEERLLGFLAESLNLLRVDLKWRAIPRAVLELVPEDKAREYHVIPVDREVLHGTSYLLLATCDPTNLTNLDDLAFLTGCEIRPALASEEEIRAAIERCYGGKLEPPVPSAPVPDSTPVDEQDKFHKLLLLLLAKGLISRSEYDLLK